MYAKRGNVKITKIVSDLRDAIVDLKKVVLFEYEKPLSVRSSYRLLPTKWISLIIFL